MASEYFDFIISTNRFNLSERQPHFINDTCFGEDLAAWLVEQLGKEGIPAEAPGQEDWGWYFSATSQDEPYFFAINGDDDGHEEMPNQGEWRISIHKTRSVMDKLMGRNFFSNDDKILYVVRRILKSQPDIKIIGTESSSS